MEITANISIEELVRLYPQSVHWLRERGMICIVCGEPVWGKLGDFLAKNNFSKEEVLLLIDEMRTEL